jgi:hypothetical protein
MNTATLDAIAQDRFYKNFFPSTVSLLFGLCSLALVGSLSAAAMPAPQDPDQPTSAPAGATAAPSPQAAMAPAPQGSNPASTLAAPASAKATIYVYRNGKGHGAAGLALIFVNGNFLAVLHHSNFAEREVPQGAAVVGAILREIGQADSVYSGLSQYFPPTLRWPKCGGAPRKPSCTWDASVQAPTNEDHGCARVDWQRLDEARPEDVRICRAELSATSAALDNWLDPNRKANELFLGMLLPTALGGGLLADSMSGPKGDLRAWLQMCGSDPFPARSSQQVDKIRSDLKRGDNSDDWSRCKNEAAAADLALQLKERVRVEAEAGKTYYVKWSLTASGGKMELVDEAKGAKEVRGLRLAKD